MKKETNAGRARVVTRGIERQARIVPMSRAAFQSKSGIERKPLITEETFAIVLRIMA